MAAPQLHRAVVIALAGFVLSACGGGDENGARTRSPASPTTTTAAESDCVREPEESPTLEGTFTSTITEADVQARGVTGHDVGENLGTFTLVLENGEWSMSQAAPSPVRWPEFSGTYLVGGNRLELIVDTPDEFAGDRECKEFTQSDGSVTFEVVTPDEPTIRAVWESHPWSEAPPSA